MKKKKRNVFRASSNATGTWNGPMIKVLGTDRHKRNLGRHVRGTQRYYDTDREERKKGKGWSGGEAAERKGEERRAHTRFEKRLPILDQRKMARCDEKAREEKPPTVGGHRSSQNSPRDFSRYRFRFLLFFFSFFFFSFLCLHSCHDFRRYWANHAGEYNSTRELWLVINGRWLTKQSRDRLLSKLEAVEMIKPTVVSVVWIYENCEKVQMIKLGVSPEDFTWQRILNVWTFV